MGAAIHGSSLELTRAPAVAAVMRWVMLSCFVGSFACGGARTNPSPAPVESSEHSPRTDTSADPTADPVADPGPPPARTDAQLALRRRCVEASTVQWPRFMAPSGGRAFREAVPQHLEEVRCCGADELRRAVLAVDFVPDATDDFARGRLSESSDPLDPVVAQCVRAVVQRWELRPAPRSDVIRAGRSSAARLRVSLGE